MEAASLASAISKLSRASWRRKRHLAEAVIVLIGSRFLTLFPMRIYTRACGTRWDLEPTEAHIMRGKEVASAVKRAAGVVPFKSVCIEQTIATSLMLRIRGVPATAHIGVNRDPDRRVDALGYNSHAWLNVGDRVVIGGPDVSAFVSLAHFP